MSAGFLRQQFTESGSVDGLSENCLFGAAIDVDEHAFCLAESHSLSEGVRRVTGIEALVLGSKMSLNSVSVSELVVVPGIGPKLAARIIDFRQANGPFLSLDSVRAVRGIGPSLSARLGRYAEVFKRSL